MAWGTVWDYLFSDEVLQGVLVTCWLTAAVMAVGIALGTALAVMRLSEVRFTSGFAAAYAWFFRGVPALILLYLWFNLPAIFPRLGIGIPFTSISWSAKTTNVITPIVASILALGLSESAYYCEIVRGGILSVPRGQHDAARAFGMTRLMALRRIVLPQAMRFIVPPTGNEVIGMLKYTSIASVISVAELTEKVTAIYSVSFQVMPLLAVAAIWYLAVTSVLSVGQSFLERHYSAGATGGFGR